MDRTQITALLRQNALKVTAPRVSIIQILTASHAPDIQTIKQALIRSGHKIDTVTIYRTLDSLKQKGVVTEVNLGEGKARYELNTTHHHHLVCQNCGHIDSYDRSDITPIEQDIQKHHGFKVTRHHLEFFGLCRSCRIKSSNSKP
jgi:Fe2+ or Zn2+ uptake regulation protein